jgi:hypothetical protein
VKAKNNQGDTMGLTDKREKLLKELPIIKTESEQKQGWQIPHPQDRNSAHQADEVLRSHPRQQRRRSAKNDIEDELAAALDAAEA